MNWLDELLHRAKEAKPAEPPKRELMPSERVQSAPEIECEWMQTAAPRPPNYPGAVEQVFYFVRGGVVTLCDERGNSTGRGMSVGSNDPRTIVRLLARTAKPLSDFNRQINYQPWGIA